MRVVAGPMQCAGGAVTVEGNAYQSAMGALCAVLQVDTNTAQEDSYAEGVTNSQSSGKKLCG